METENFITKEMTIGDVVNKYPETTSIMLNYGLHCVGCAVNPYETIENGCLGHGIDEETIDKLIKDLNQEIAKRDERFKKIISITDNASKKFKEFIKGENKNYCGIRFGVVDTGSTLQYTLDFADSANENEEVFEDNGLKIFIEKESVNLIKGTQIDYIENERGSGFKIDNPSAEKSSGCGSGCGCH
ncbi:iron-sulfur cluster assembly accessory protein [Candidatus Woesearchaeota archaeon]|nr:iron-sulfur cluster assembly accessory protein [Candidatus Woesearchaeota archaeon]